MENSVIGYGVYYAPNRQGRVFANLKNELYYCFLNELEANKHADHLNVSGALDELHFGYVVYPLNYLPKGYTLR